MRSIEEGIRQAIRNHGQNLTVLVIRLGAMGDVLRTLPAVRLVRFGLPDAAIFWAVDEGWASLLDSHPDLDGVLPFPRKRWGRMAGEPPSWPGLAAETLEWLADLNRGGVDMVLDFHGNLRAGLVSRASGAPVRLGYLGHHQKEGNRFFNTHHVPAGGPRTPRIERNLDLVRYLGLPAEPLPDGGLPFRAEQVRQARDLVAAVVGRGKRYAILAPGASRLQAYKKPPPHLLAAAAARLADHGVTPIVVHGPGEEEDAGAVVRESGGKGKIAPSTNLPMLAALLRHARVFVGGDSGPMHLACAVGCPVVAVYGPTDPVVNGPWGVPHVVVYPPEKVYTGNKKLDRRPPAFAGLRPDHMVAAVERVLALGRTATQEGRPEGRS